MLHLFRYTDSGSGSPHHRQALVLAGAIEGAPSPFGGYCASSNLAPIAAARFRELGSEPTRALADFALQTVAGLKPMVIAPAEPSRFNNPEHTLAVASGSRPPVSLS